MVAEFGSSCAVGLDEKQDCTHERQPASATQCRQILDFNWCGSKHTFTRFSKGEAKIVQSGPDRLTPVRMTAIGH